MLIISDLLIIWI